MRVGKLPFLLVQWRRGDSAAAFLSAEESRCVSGLAIAADDGCTCV